MGKIIDLTGQKFGKLTVIKRLGSDKYKKAIWLCQCDCGNLKQATSNNLRRGLIKSCGCIKGKYLREQSNFYTIKGDIVELKIQSKKYGEIVFIIDNDDLDIIKNYQWTVRKLYSNFYAYTGKWKGKAIALHRLISKCPDNLVVDHINRNTLDNRKCNLRLCNNLVNIKNRPTNKVGYRGIILNSSGNYRVRLQINKVKYEKTFKLLEDAINYRKELEEKYHKKEEIICPM